MSQFSFCSRDISFIETASSLVNIKAKTAPNGFPLTMCVLKGSTIFTMSISGPFLPMIVKFLL